MKAITQCELLRPDLTVWEKTFLPTTSLRTKRLSNGSLVATSSVWRPSEDGIMGSLERSWNEIQDARIAALSSQWEESLSSWQDMQTSSSETLCPYSTSVLMERLEKLALTSEETTDESTSEEWLPTPSISDTSLGRMVSGSLRRIISWSVSTIRRITRSLLG